ncbi:MAG: hypothetical protein AB7I30_17435 [Isosphaeraceae bacterium]
MTPSLERLSEIVRLAEAKSRSKKVEAEAKQAAERLREASHQAGLAARRNREERPARLRQIEQADQDEQQLKEVLKKLAQYRSALEPGVSAESLADAAKAEIDASRREARAALEILTREAEEGRRQLRLAMEHYQQLRKEIDRLQPATAGSFAADDRLLWDAETYFPGGMLQALAREVESGAPFFGMLSRPEQYAQLKIWIGRYRQFQDEGDSETFTDAEAEECQAQAQRVFVTLKGLSKQYEPGYIDAFRLDFQTDWAHYVGEAQAQLQQAVDSAKLARAREHQRGEQQVRDAERLVLTRESGRTALAGLQAMIARAGGEVADEDLEDFLGLLRQAVLGLGASDPDLLDLAAPYRDFLEGDELRALRRNLDRARRDDDSNDADDGRFDDLIPLTQGKTAVMIGGSPREDVRRSLQSLDPFERLDWESSEDTKPAALDSLERRVRNRGVDVVVLLRSFIGHSVSDRLRPACEQAGVPCVLVDRGYGSTQIGEALRRALNKTDKTLAPEDANA